MKKIKFETGALIVGSFGFLLILAFIFIYNEPINIKSFSYAFLAFLLLFFFCGIMLEHWQNKTPKIIRLLWFISYHLFMAIFAIGLFNNRVDLCEIGGIGILLHLFIVIVFNWYCQIVIILNKNKKEIEPSCR